MSSLKKYKKVKYLGKGSYGAAILVELKTDSKTRFVIKEIVIGHLKEAEQAAAKKEAEVLHQMNHSNIVMYIESFVENSKLYIVMEHADGGDLSEAIKRKKSSSAIWMEDEVMRIFVQICLALKHVHDRNILHRDLKSQNIFLTSKGIVKLGDFGIAKVLDASEDQARTQIGTPYYLSPEICESKPYGNRSDMWSLGVVLYELIVLELPFQAQSLPGLIHKIISSEPNWSPIQTNYSADLLDLNKVLLAKDPNQRPTSRDTVKCNLIRAHISKLLSHTLKVGTGGAEGAAVRRSTDQALTPAPGLGPDEMIDPEEADQNIERERAREVERVREREKLDAAMEKERQREEDLKNLKKLKQEKKASAQEEEQIVILAPKSLPPVAPPPNILQSPYQEGQDGYRKKYPNASVPQAAGAGGGEPDYLSRKASEPDIHRSPRLYPDRYESASALGNRPLDRPSDRQGDPYRRDSEIERERDRQQRERHLNELREERALAAAMSRADDRQAQELRRVYQENQILANENRRRGSGSNAAGGGGVAGALVDIDQLLHAPPYRAGGVSPGVGGAVVRPAPPVNRQGSGSSNGNASPSPSLANPYASQDSARRQPSGGVGSVALIAGGANAYAVQSARAGYRGPSPPSSQVQTPGVNPLEEATRNQFFSNREAAQIIKAKIEADMRGPDNLSGVGGGGGYSRAAGSGGGSRGGGGESYNGLNDDRAAEVRARREREKEREIAEKESQLQVAYEAHRQAIRDLEMKRRGSEEKVKSPVSLNEDYHVNYDRERERERELERRRKAKEDQDERQRQALMDEARKARQEARALRDRGGAVAFEIDFGDGPKENKDPPSGRFAAAGGKQRDSKENLFQNEDSVTSSPRSGRSKVAQDLQDKLPKQRRGWGAPVEDIKLPAGRISVAGRVENPPISSQRRTENTSSSSSNVSPALGVDGFGEENTESDSPNAEEIVNIKKRLEARESRQQNDRENAKMIFRKLKDQKKKESSAITVVKTAKPPAMSGKGIPAERLLKANKFDEMMGKVNEAAAMVEKVVGNANANSRSNSGSKALAQETPLANDDVNSDSCLLIAPSQSQSGRGGDSGLFELSDSEDLERTIDRFVLNKQPQQNSQHQQQLQPSGPSQQPLHRPLSGGIASNSDYERRSNGPDDGVGVGVNNAAGAAGMNRSRSQDTEDEILDGDVTSLQCVLANALLIGNEDNDDGENDPDP